MKYIGLILYVKKSIRSSVGGGGGGGVSYPFSRKFTLTLICKGSRYRPRDPLTNWILPQNSPLSIEKYVFVLVLRLKKNPLFYGKCATGKRTTGVPPPPIHVTFKFTLMCSWPIHEKCLFRNNQPANLFEISSKILYAVNSNMHCRKRDSLLFIMSCQWKCSI